jgi:trimethylamine:corrinoid methyltransferase-like protein
MWTNRLKPYDILSGEDVEAIHEQAMTILDRGREEYPDPGIDPGVDEQLREYITKRKGEPGDD